MLDHSHLCKDDVLISIKQSDWYDLPSSVRELIQMYGASNPMLIPKNGIITTHMTESRWAEITEEMRRIGHVKA
jgi:hypothetical protein